MGRCESSASDALSLFRLETMPEFTGLPKKAVVAILQARKGWKSGQNGLICRPKR
jgi:hypothetical protein